MLKPKFNRKKLNAELQKKVQRIQRAIISRLQFVGETFVNNARNKNRDDGGFGDITGNLRSSIGYMVMFKGKPVFWSAFDVVEGGADGAAKGKRYIKKIANKYKDNGFVLIVVAGMDYAAAVESKSKDVITGSGLIAEAELKIAFETLKRKIKKK